MAASHRSGGRPAPRWPKLPDADLRAAHRVLIAVVHAPREHYAESIGG
ncbi:hypothetical protein [Nocardia sp. R7R-8]